MHLCFITSQITYAPQRCILTPDDEVNCRTTDYGSTSVSVSDEVYWSYLNQKGRRQTAYTDFWALAFKRSQPWISMDIDCLYGSEKVHSSAS